MQRAVWVALLVFAAPTLRANGVAGADVLTTHPSARAAALGNAFAALGDDLGALSFNPAGLAELKTPSLSFLHHVGIATVSTEHVAYGHPLSFGVLGGGLLYRSQADIANPLATDPPVTAFDVSLDAFYAVRPSHFFSDLPGLLADAETGVNLKYLRSHLGRFDADTVALDLGLRTPLSNGLELGVSVLNLGPPIKFIDVADPLPSSFLVGVSRSFEPFKDNILRFAADAEAPFYSAFRGHLGAEDWLGKSLALRGGYIVDSEHSLSGFSGGFGLKLDQEGLLFEFDYAFVPFYYDGFSSFEPQHIFQMSLGF